MQSRFVSPSIMMLSMVPVFFLLMMISAVDGYSLRRHLNQGDNDDNDNSHDSSLGAAAIHDLCFIVLIGVASTLGLVLAVYLTCRIMDLWSRRGRRHNRQNGDLDCLDDGPISRKANLRGLTRGERARILPRLFQATTFQWQGDNDVVQQNAFTTTKTILHQEERANQQDEQSSGATSDESSDMSSDDGENYQEQQLPPPPPAVKAENANDAEVDDPAAACCSICLTPFTGNDTSVMTGTKCPHVFHSQCCMEWLRLHDHCPYCRQEMMTPEEFRQAAVEVLGLRRVQALELPGLQGTLDHNVRIPLAPLPQPGPRQRPVVTTTATPTTEAVPVVEQQQQQDSPNTTTTTTTTLSSPDASENV